MVKTSNGYNELDDNETLARKQMAHEFDQVELFKLIIERSKTMLFLYVKSL